MSICIRENCMFTYLLVYWVTQIISFWNFHKLFNQKDWKERERPTYIGAVGNCGWMHCSIAVGIHLRKQNITICETNLFIPNPNSWTYKYLPKIDIYRWCGAMHLCFIAISQRKRDDEWDAIWIYEYVVCICMRVHAIYENGFHEIFLHWMPNQSPTQKRLSKIQ